MSETTTEPTPETEAPETPEAETPAAEETAPEPEVDWRDKFEGQRKVNRDLEAKFKKAAAEAERAAELQAKLEGREAEYQAELAKREAEQAALSKANDRIIRSEVKAAAKGVLADPADAYKFLDLDSFEVGNDGDVDEGAIADALADLVKSKPYLAAQSSRKFQGTADGGARNDAMKPTQLSEQDVQRLYAEGRHDEIVKAKAEGRLNDYLAS